MPTIRRVGKAVVDQPRRRIGHSPPDARRTDRTTLAGKRHELVATAVGAVAPNKAVRQDAALEVTPELVLHVRRVSIAAGVLPARVREREAGAGYAGVGEESGGSATSQ
jgi:hypothetical protein